MGLGQRQWGKPSELKLAARQYPIGQGGMTYGWSAPDGSYL